jgi:hypothetical protein
MVIEISEKMTLDEIEETLNDACEEDFDDFLKKGWRGLSLDGSESPDSRGFFDGTGDLAWTETEYIVIDIYADERKDVVCRGKFSETEKRDW